MEYYDMSDKELLDIARSMCDKAYAPYSDFHVGAALITDDGSIYTGCNIENASYGATNCAERTAFFKAISEGESDFKAIAVVGGNEGKVESYCFPCGVCRQVMMEFCNPETFIVIAAKSREEYLVQTLSQILPNGFGPASLKEHL